ncbi:hypothetical protein GCM10018780_86880 [Streptomyces lanatus]|nr:hypothetical protein GCM10018780_86880 [Streptomyces lanatus]
MDVTFRECGRTGGRQGVAEPPCVRAWVMSRQTVDGEGVTTADVDEGLRQRAWRGSSARDGVTEGGKDRSDGPLPSQTQHAADHTRPKSM